MQAVVEKTGVSPAEIGDIVIGSVLAPGAQRANECRMAAFFAGFPGELIAMFLMAIYVMPLRKIVVFFMGVFNAQVTNNLGKYVYFMLFIEMPL